MTEGTARLPATPSSSRRRWRAADADLRSQEAARTVRGARQIPQQLAGTVCVLEEEDQRDGADQRHPRNAFARRDPDGPDRTVEREDGEAEDPEEVAALHHPAPEARDRPAVVEL